MKHMVFVYGTLRHNELNHYYLDGAELVSKQAYIFGELWDTGFGYPAVVLGHETKVYGEIYRVNEAQLQELDRLEDYYGPGGPNLYERMEQPVYTDQVTYTAYVYIFLEIPENGVHIKNGDWVAQTNK